MRIKDWTKFAVSIGVLIAMTALIWVDKVPPDTGVPVIAALLGYVFGNAHGVMEANGEAIRREKA